MLLSWFYFQSLEASEFSLNRGGRRGVTRVPWSMVTPLTVVLFMIAVWHRKKGRPKGCWYALIGCCCMLLSLLCRGGSLPVSYCSCSIAIVVKQCSSMFSLDI